MGSLLLLLLCVSCRDPFNPFIPTSKQNILVVESFINTSGNGVTRLSLSRSYVLTDTVRNQPEQGAQVTIEGSDHTQFAISDSGAGNYESLPLSLNQALAYRLNITCTNGEAYTTEFM